MGRIKRADAAGAIYHMLNRGNRRATIFEAMRGLSNILPLSAARWNSNCLVVFFL